MTSVPNNLLNRDSLPTKTKADANDYVPVVSAAGVPSCIPAIGMLKAETPVGEVAFVQGSGNAVNDASTFGGYTVQQVVKALQTAGILP